MSETEAKTKITSYLSFTLGDEVFAANVSKVLNILEMCKITKVPKAPEYMIGVINLRGAVLPLVDTRIKFQMQKTEFTSNTCILVLEIQLEEDIIRVGALVDSVQEVLEIEEEQLQPAPKIGNTFNSEFISSMYRKDEADDFIMILEMDRIFSSDEITVLKSIERTENNEK